MKKNSLLLLVMIIHFYPATARETNPPVNAVYKIGIKINAVAEGEMFEFSITGSSVRLVVTKANTLFNFPGTYATGFTYTVNQLAGPRTCTLTSNRTGTVGNSDIEMNVDSGSPPGKSLLTGIFTAPVGVNVVIQKDGITDLTLIAKPDGNKKITQNHFSFPTPYTDGLPYSLTVKSVPPGITCTIYKGKIGTTGLSPDFIRIGADFTYDLVSCSSNNNMFATYYESQSPVIGGKGPDDGRYVAFVSGSAGMEGSTGKHRQIFWRDRNTGETKLISRSANGEEGDGDSFAPSISADGKSVAFESYSANFSEDDKNGVRDIFIWNAVTGIIICASLGDGGINGNAESTEPALSGDGNIIAFSSAASNLTPLVEGNAAVNVFLRNLLTGSIKLISADRITKKGVGGSVPSISEDGSRVAFCSFSSNLTTADNNNLWDIFLYDSHFPELKRISVTATGGERNQGTESASRVVAPAISGNGWYIAYATTASNVVPGDTNGSQDIFVCEVETGKTVRVEPGNNGAQANADCPVAQGERPAISYNGNWIAFTSKASNLAVPADNIILYSLLTKETKPVTAINGGSVARPAISGNGGYVIFGAGSQLDTRFRSSGLFAAYLGISRCRECAE